MNESEILIEALGQVPDLVEAAKTYKASNEKTITTMATAIKERPEAVIPQTEVEKVTEAVKVTPCALPDTEKFVNKIANIIRPIIQQEIKDAIGVTKFTLKHEHKHTHHSLSGFWNIVNDVAKKWIIVLAISTLILAATLITGVVHLVNSEMYLGKKYMEIYESGLLTQSEKEQFLKDSYIVSRYPKAYKGYPKAFRERLRKNNAIINDREHEKCFKGKVSGKPKVEF